MVRQQSAPDMILDGGFRIGFLIMVVGIIMFYMSMFENTVNLTFDYLEFWEKFRTFPEWVQVIVGGIMFVGIALIVSVGRVFVESMIQTLFGRDQGF
jgi:hypothetical protein